MVARRSRGAFQFYHWGDPWNARGRQGRGCRVVWGLGLFPLLGFGVVPSEGAMLQFEKNTTQDTVFIEFIYLVGPNYSH